MGVPFEERHSRMDEALEVLRAVWTGEGVRSQGLAYHAIDQTATPLPMQRPHPPIWIGGNSRASRERVARVGQGWAPILNNELAASTTRTALLADESAFESALDEVRELTRAAGRDPDELEIQLNAGGAADKGPDAELERIERFSKLGVTQYLRPFFVGGADNGHEDMLRFAEQVLDVRDA